MPQPTEKKVLKGHTDTVTCVAWSADGKTLASSSNDKTAILWDLEKGEPRAKFSGHTDGVLSLCFCAKGALLATASADRDVMLWNTTSASTDKPVATLSGHRNWVNCVARFARRPDAGHGQPRPVGQAVERRFEKGALRDRGLRRQLVGRRVFARWPNASHRQP